MYEKVLWIFKRKSNENNLKKEKMELLTKEQQQSYKCKIRSVCNEKFENKYLREKNIVYHIIIKELAG